MKRTLALGRGPVDTPALKPNDRWSLDFAHDRLRNNRRFRILGVGDDCTRENLVLEADFAFSGELGLVVLTLPVVPLAFAAVAGGTAIFAYAAAAHHQFHLFALAAALAAAVTAFCYRRADALLTAL